MAQRMQRTAGGTVTGLERRAGHSGTAIVEHAAAAPRAVPVLRRAVAAFAASHGADERLLGDIRLAVSEAVANVVMHAYEPGDRGEVYLRAAIVSGALEVVIADDGLGIRNKPSEGQGLGLGILANVTSDFAIRERAEGGTEIRMRFFLES
jgi:anti-sigma regulatory factor (Ser/Thr protein kinase)